MLVGPGPMKNADHPLLVGSDRPDPFVPLHATLPSPKETLALQPFRSDDRGEVPV